MWGDIKRFVGIRNEFNMVHVKVLADERRVGPEQKVWWEKSYLHSRKYAVDQWQADALLLQDEDSDATPLDMEGEDESAVAFEEEQ